MASHVHSNIFGLILPLFGAAPSAQLGHLAFLISIGILQKFNYFEDSWRIYPNCFIQSWMPTFTNIGGAIDRVEYVPDVDIE